MVAFHEESPGLEDRLMDGFMAHGLRALRGGDAVAAEGFFRMVLAHCPDHAGATAGLQAALGQDPSTRSEGAAVGLTWLFREPRQAGAG